MIDLSGECDEGVMELEPGNIIPCSSINHKKPPTKDLSQSVACKKMCKECCRMYQKCCFSELKRQLDLEEILRCMKKYKYRKEAESCRKRRINCYDSDYIDETACDRGCGWRNHMIYDCVFDCGDDSDCGCVCGFRNGRYCGCDRNCRSGQSRGSQSNQKNRIGGFGSRSNSRKMSLNQMNGFDAGGKKQSNLENRSSFVLEGSMPSIPISRRSKKGGLRDYGTGVITQPTFRKRRRNCSDFMDGNNCGCDCRWGNDMMCNCVCDCSDDSECGCDCSSRNSRNFCWDKNRRNGQSHRSWSNRKNRGGGFGSRRSWSNQKSLGEGSATRSYNRKSSDKSGGIQITNSVDDGSTRQSNLENYSSFKSEGSMHSIPISRRSSTKSASRDYGTGAITLPSDTFTTAVSRIVDEISKLREGVNDEKAGRTVGANGCNGVLQSQDINCPVPIQTADRVGCGFGCGFGGCEYNGYGCGCCLHSGCCGGGYEAPVPSHDFYCKGCYGNFTKGYNFGGSQNTRIPPNNGIFSQAS